KTDESNKNHKQKTLMVATLKKRIKQYKQQKQKSRNPDLYPCRQVLVMRPSPIITIVQNRLIAFIDFVEFNLDITSSNAKKRLVFNDIKSYFPILQTHGN